MAGSYALQLQYFSYYKLAGQRNIPTIYFIKSKFKTDGLFALYVTDFRKCLSTCSHSYGILKSQRVLSHVFLSYRLERMLHHMYHTCMVLLKYVFSDVG